MQSYTLYLNHLNLSDKNSILNIHTSYLFTWKSIIGCAHDFGGCFPGSSIVLNHIYLISCSLGNKEFSQLTGPNFKLKLFKKFVSNWKRKQEHPLSPVLLPTQKSVRLFLCFVLFGECYSHNCATTFGHHSRGRGSSLKTNWLRNFCTLSRFSKFNFTCYYCVLF